MSLTPNFTNLLGGIANQGEVIAPLFRSALTHPRWSKFSIEMDPYEERSPDGWFHPSTHPLWGSAELYWWVTRPEAFEPPGTDPTKTLAVSVGNMFHDFFQHIGLAHDILVKHDICGHPEARTSGFMDAQAEVCLEDADTNTRGHGDGQINPDIMPRAGFEAKSINPMTGSGIPANKHVEDPQLLDWLKERKPEYVAQAYDYLRLTGWERMIFLIIPTAYPFTFVEIHLTRDERAIRGIESKYREVIERVGEGKPFPLCHTPGTKGFDLCPACRMTALLNS